MYSFGIYIYLLCIKFAAIFHKKARLMVEGHRKTYHILEEKIDPREQYLWFHAASLGEFEQGRPLIEKIHANYPQYKILLTFFSPSGYEVRKDYDGADIVCYLPFDTLFNAKRFVRMARPCMAFFIKYEFWQNYISILHQYNIPTFSISSIFRPNQIYFHRWTAPFNYVLKNFTHFFVQNEASKKLLNEYGYKKASVVGDTRFDRVIQIRDNAKEIPLAETFANVSPQKNILVAGSTWPPDEDILINYFNSHEELRIILAPHVVTEEHLKDIETKLHRPSIRFNQATEDEIKKADCLIIDCYGMLSSIYKYGQIAYVGGGFGAGIHNISEAAVYGIPVIIGPKNEKFQEARDLLSLGGCFEISDNTSFEKIMSNFALNPETILKSGKIAGKYITNHTGAVDKIMRAIDFSKIPSFEEARNYTEYNGLKQL